MGKVILKIKKVSAVIMLVITFVLLFACDSKIRTFSIRGTYVSNSMMGYEAKVEAGTITIYSVTPFEKTVYWHGTCNESDLDENNKLVSKRLETESDRNWFYDFGSMRKSSMSSKEILFTDRSLTFIYDMSGMAISQETLYKVESDSKSSGFDSNAEKADPNYVEPSKPLPHEIPRNQKPTETETETPSERSNEKEVIVDEETFTL